MWFVAALTGRSAADATLSGTLASPDGHSGFVFGTAVAVLATVLSLFRPESDSRD